MDRKDHQIVRALMHDGRLSNQDLAAAVNLSPSPCLRRVRLLEERGVITGYAALVDQKAMGYPITVFVGIRLSKHDQATVQAFERAIGAIDDILDCFLMTGDIDYLLRVVAPDLDGYERFVRRLQALAAVQDINSSFAIRTVKSSGALPLEAASTA